MVGSDWLALDIGGANLKAAHSLGACRSTPFAVWKHPGDLGLALGRLIESMPTSTRLAVTMTAEISDCFGSRAEGVQRVLNAVVSASMGRGLTIWGTDGRFHDLGEIRRQPIVAASANWLALATFVARNWGEPGGLLIDIGSTTTDLIPLAAGRPLAQGRSDYDRLRNGELVYAGVGRTPIASLATSLPFRGRPTSMSSELFATTLDIYLILGHCACEPENCDTADGRPRTVEAARRRLARMIGLDVGQFTVEEANQLAVAGHRALLDRLVKAARHACESTMGEPHDYIIAGSGESLAREVIDRLLKGSDRAHRILSLRECWGPMASAVAPAVALTHLINEPDHGPEADQCASRIGSW